MIKVITTVGTSLFTNYMRKEVQKYWEDRASSDATIQNYNIDTNYKSLFKEQNSNRTEKAIETAIETRWVKDIETYVDKEGDLQCREIKGLNDHCCAEVQTLLAIAQKDEYKGKTLEVHLLCTDTALSKLAAKIIAKIDFGGVAIEFADFDGEKYFAVPDLQVKDAVRFEEKGFINLVDKVISIKGEDTNTILNISGGYKALIPPLTLLAQLEQMPLYYIYEDSGGLIETGNLPINFDWEYVYYFVLLIKKSALNYISPVFQDLQYFEKEKILEHQNLLQHKAFLNKNMSSENAQKIQEIKHIFPVYKKMLLEKIIVFDYKNNQIKPTILGTLLEKYAERKQLIGSGRMGPLVELFCHKFFAIPAENRQTKGTEYYTLNLSPTYKETTFTIENNRITLGTANGRDAKDIDIHLHNSENGAIVLGECKTAWAFINKSKKAQYADQIRARVLQQLKINAEKKELKSVNFLFIVLDFKLFVPVEFADEQERDQEFKDAVNIFRKIESDSQIAETIREITKKTPKVSLTFKVQTMILQRTLSINKDGIIDWKHLFMEVDSAKCNNISIF